MSPEIRARFAKVRALAQSGATPGERQAAQARLDEMTAKYGSPDAQRNPFSTVMTGRSGKVTIDEFGWPTSMSVEDVFEMMAEHLKNVSEAKFTQAYNDQRYRENTAHADRMAAEARIRRRAAERNAEAEHARRQRSDAISARAFLRAMDIDPPPDADDQWIINFAMAKGWTSQ